MGRLDGKAAIVIGGGHGIGRGVRVDVLVNNAYVADGSGHINGVQWRIPPP